MLDIRAIHYPSPLSEVDFKSVPLSVRLKNYADETGLVTGMFRVYNDTSGLLIFSSEIEPINVAAGVTIDVSSLTDFDPPAPADDVYFVLFDGAAVNALVPDGISIHRGAFYFDVKPVGMGPAPAAHHATHEDGGSDEIDCTGLTGTGGAGGNIEDMPTAEMDDALVLAPDGAGGVEFRAESGGGGSGLSETPQTLTDQAAIDWDLSLGGAATVTLAGDRTLNEATNMVDGSHASLKVIQDGTGTRLLTWHATYRFPGGIKPTLSAAVNSIDILLFSCDGTYLDCIGMVSAVA
jgi:hypothetical protein